MTNHIPAATKMVAPDHFQAVTKLIPGPVLDRLVAEKVMGWEPFGELSEIGAQCYASLDGTRRVSPGRSSDFEPSANIAHALEVVGHFAGKLHDFSLNFYGDMWMAGFGEHDPCGCMKLNGDPSSISGDTAPHAICLAALKAVGVEMIE